METKLTDDIRCTVRGEQAGAFSIAICMEWNALYEQALTAAESALAEERAKREEAKRKLDESTTLYLRERERANGLGRELVAYKYERDSERARADVATWALLAIAQETRVTFGPSDQPPAMSEQHATAVLYGVKRAVAEVKRVLDIGKSFESRYKEMQEYVHEICRVLEPLRSDGEPVPKTVAALVARADRAEAALANARSERDEFQAAYQQMGNRLVEVERELADLRAFDAVMAKRIATARSEALREAAGVCEALRNELYRRADREGASDIHQRNAIAGTVALDKARDRLLALIGASESGEGGSDGQP